jgi:iron complex outermembrane receptor protein
MWPVGSETTRTRETGFGTAFRIAALLLLIAPALAWCQSDLTNASLEELLSLKVTSVSKTERSLSRTAASVFVITQEDIHRSGATNLPDLLRMVPGVNVFQINANTWAISIRGFNQRYSDKVLVMIDGRSVYTPAFSDVFWEQLSPPLENIERIEVVRGPGGSVWGANAVNGVINIITKSAKDTKGGLVSAMAGERSTSAGLLQYGADAGNDAAYRIFGQYFHAPNMPQPNGASGADGWSRSNAGFRTDWTPTNHDSVMFEGDLYANNEGEERVSGFTPTPFSQPFSQTFADAGGDLQGRWNHTLPDGSEMTLQTYYDQYRRTQYGVPDVLKLFDFDFQENVAPMGRHDLAWGLGYRVSENGLSPGYGLSFRPGFKTDSLFSAFVQDEIALTRCVWLTLGSKLEHNAFTGFEFEPSARIAWAPSARSTWWASASRAIRQPARGDTSIVSDIESMPIGPNMTEVVRLFGNPNVKAEELRDFEAGYRRQIGRKVSLDVGAFLSHYRHLETLEPQAPQTVPDGQFLEILQPFLYSNKGHARDYGGEASLNWTVNPRWKLTAGYALLHMNIALDPSSRDPWTAGQAKDTPRNSFEVQSYWTVSRRLSFDQSLHYDARMPGGDAASHARLDARLAWRLGESTELSLVGQNLLRERFQEFVDDNEILGTEVQRSAYLKFTWRF